LGKIDPDNFAGGAIRLSSDRARAAITRDVGARLGLDAEAAAFGIAEVVDENMANAARVHAVENGRDIADNVMVAFGGAAPLHAARLCEKLGIDRCLIPSGAGVGSAIGFLRAPFGYEALASRIVRLSEFDAGAMTALVDGLKATATGFVRQGASGALRCEITAFMRYVGQGWEIPVALPDRAFAAGDADLLRAAFRQNYARFFGRAIDGLDGLEIEIVTLSVKVEDMRPAPDRHRLTAGGAAVAAPVSRPVFDPAEGRVLPTGIVARGDLSPGDRLSGPAIVVERETATVATTVFDLVMQTDGSLLLLRKGLEG
jgi:N-methylhydantoinase A